VKALPGWQAKLVGRGTGKHAQACRCARTNWFWRLSQDGPENEKAPNRSTVWGFL
jgi:hypothetical protein